MSALRISPVLVLLIQNFAHAEATVSLKAVAKNGFPITPTSSLNVQPGDIVTARIFLSGWNSPPFDGGTGLLNTYVVTLAGKAGAQSSGNCPGQCNNGYILPLGWDAPIEKDSCPCDDPCYPICNVFYGCVGPNFHPNQMASINSLDPDYALFGFANFPAVDLDDLDITWGSTTDGYDGQTASRCQGGSNVGGSCSTNSECPGGVCNADFLSYLGTLNLKVGSTACGIFTFTFSSDIKKTFIANPAGIPVTVVPAIQGLTLVVTVLCAPPGGACCYEPTGTCSEALPSATCAGPNYRWVGSCSTCGALDPPCGAAIGACCFIGNCGTVECNDDVLQQGCSGLWAGAGSTCATTSLCPLGPPIIDTSPPNCIIDARRPFPPSEPTQREGFTALWWPFYNFLGTDEDEPNDFAVRQVPSTTPPVPPTITSVTWESGNSVTLQLSEPIQPNKWTCIKHNASGCEKCLGYLPGDVNSNGSVAPADILEIIDNLNGVRNPPLMTSQCDIDRSGLCAPADILSEIDLLNGANGFPVQNGRALEPCPSTTP